MKYSKITLKVLAAKECGIIKSNAEFWKKFCNKEEFEAAININSDFDNILNKIKSEFCTLDNEAMGFISVYDELFPIINKKVKNNSDKPFLLFYKGDINLLADLNNNVAVIGVTTPDERTEARERAVVNKLVGSNLVIVSGLAAGCDFIAHKACIDMKGKTIAVLPTQLGKIYPAQNREFANEIVKSGGLLVTEYYKEPLTRFEAINRFIQRDRLQAMFSKAIILIASYRKSDGHCGSRHAMVAAKKYEIDRYVMYNNKIDEENRLFGLNKDLILEERRSGVKVLQASSINSIKALKNHNLIMDNCYKVQEQVKLL